MRHRDSPPLALVALLVLASGFAALLDQTAWFRLFRGVFGASTAAHAAVVACFLAGLGLGARHFGRRVDRAPNALALYARLEGQAALAAALTPVAIALAERPYHALAASFALGEVPRTVLRLAITALVLGVPTFLMGGTLPAAIRAVASDDDGARRRVGWLYGANTLGALGGVCAATFVVLEWLGNRATAWLGAAVGVAVALVSWLVARRLGDPSAGIDAAVEPARAGNGPEGRSQRVASACAAAALAGLAFGLLELVWYRMLAPLLGGSTYTFGLILALALAGTGVGGLAYGVVRRRATVTLASVALVSALEAVAIAAPLAAGDRLAVLALATRGLGDAGFGVLVLVWSGLAALIVVPAALVAGYQFPLLVALAGEGRREAGSESGAVFAWNAAGNVVGALGGGLVLVPLLGAVPSWRVAAAVVMALGAASAALALRESGLRERVRMLATLGALACGAVLVASPGPSAAWRHQPIGVGAVPRVFPSVVARHDYLNAVRRALVWERDGRESAIGISSQDGDALLVNGKSDGNIRTDAPTQAMGGLIPAALHPAPRLALVIGFGTGSTAGWLAQVPGIERVDVVELEPEVLEVARRGPAATHDVLANPRVRLIFADAREALRQLPDRYDVIFSEPSNPYRAGVASLFSLDFFHAVADRLAPGGIFAEWLQVYDLDRATVRSVYATLGAAFASVETWETQIATDLLLVASAAPLVHDEARLAARAASEPFRRALDVVWGVDGLAGLYTGFVADARFTRALVSSASTPPPINTDDLNVLEFAAARNLARRDALTVAEVRASAASLGAARPEGVLGLDWTHVAELRQARALAEEGDPAAAGAGASVPGGPLAEARRQARLAYARGDLARASWLWPGFTTAIEPPLEPGTLPPIDRVLVAELLASQADARAREWIDGLAGERPATAECLWTILAAARRERAAVAAHGLEALRLLRGDPWVHRPLVLRTLSALYTEATRDPAFGRAFFDTLSEPFAVRILEDTRITLRAQVGLSSDFAGLCGEALAPLEPWPPWNRELLEARRRCYEESADARLTRARADLVSFDAETALRP
jgi:spermidine synthase